MTTPLPRRAALRGAAAAVVGAAVLPSSACTSSGGQPRPGTTSQGRRQTARHEVVLRTGGPAAAVDPAAPPTSGAAAGATPGSVVTVRASRALLERATVVVVTSSDPEELAAGTAAARGVAVPLLVAGPEVAGELERLGARTVILYSGTPVQLPASGEVEVVEGGSDGSLPDVPGLPLTPPEPGASLLVLEGAEVPGALDGLLHAAGAVRIPMRHSDPRLDRAATKGLAGTGDGPVLAVGTGLGSDTRLASRVRTARHAPELPGGGLVPFPGRMMVALYGHPQTTSMGMLGEQPATEAVRRVRRLADQYGALTDTPVTPAFELIATVAAASRQTDGSYSRRTDIAVLLPWVEAAEAAGVYVVLDLQPGRTDFLTQAKAYEPLLRRPWVGLALDPEWRLRPGQVHLEQIGSVGVEEVNRVGAWLAAIVRRHDLPPKVLTLHQFDQRMIRDRDRLDTSLDEIQWLVHADGLGSQADKQATWRALRRDLPRGVWLGWKNFEDEDSPMLTPAQTIAQVQPTPWFISYQ